MLSRPVLHTRSKGAVKSVSQRFRTHIFNLIEAQRTELAGKRGGVEQG